MLLGLQAVFFDCMCKRGRWYGKINDILKQQPYVDVQLGEEYHQSEVKFSTEEDKAVVPKVLSGEEQSTVKKRSRDILWRRGRWRNL